MNDFCSVNNFFHCVCDNLQGYRIGLFWSDLSNHIARIVVKSHGHTHFLDRTVVGLLHLVTLLLGRQGSAVQVYMYMCSYVFTDKMCVLLVHEI